MAKHWRRRSREFRKLITFRRVEFKDAGGSTIQTIRAVNDSVAKAMYAVGIVDRGALRKFMKERLTYYFLFQQGGLNIV